MPPALSDADSSGDEHMPPRGKPAPRTVEADHQGDSAASDDDDEEAGPDEYVVEKVLSHKFVKGELLFEVKWQGYDSPKDRTWEPETNMEGAIDVLNEYFDEIGGRPEPKTGQKRKGRVSGVAKSESGTPAKASIPKRAKKEWSPPPGSWEHDVREIDTIEQNPNPKTGENEKFVYLKWNNDRKTQHPLRHIRQKCPQKLLDYYEHHLVFSPVAEAMNGQDQNDVSMEDESG